MSDAVKMLITFVLTMVANLVAKKTGVELDVEETAGLVATIIAFVLGKKYLEGKGDKVTTPDLNAFRTKVLDAFEHSDFAKSSPAGLLDRIKAAGA